MNQVERARRFAQFAYSAALGEIVREFDEKRHAVRVRLAADEEGMSLDTTSSEEAEIDGELIEAKIKAQLNTLLDGYELNGVPIDDEMATAITSEVVRSLEASIAPRISSSETIERLAVMRLLYLHQVRQHVRISPAWIQAEIDRRRVVKKRPFWKQRQADTTTMYHVEGDIPPANVNSTDNSVNVVIKNHERIFSDLRQKMESCLREGPERTVILEKLTALEQAQCPRSRSVTQISSRQGPTTSCCSHPLFLRKCQSKHTVDRLNPQPA